MSQTSRFQNLYVARLTTQDRPCFVCNKFTAVVLTSADNSNADWFYICRSHLADTNFCSRIGGTPPLPKSPKSTPKGKQEQQQPPPESDSFADLFTSIGSAWSSWRRKTDNKKKEDGKEQGKNEPKPKEDEEPTQEQQDEKGPRTPSPPPAPNQQQQQPVRFILHRDYFYLRQREHIRKAQKKEANEKLKALQFSEVPKHRPTARTT